MSWGKCKTLRNYLQLHKLISRAVTIGDQCASLDSFGTILEFFLNIFTELAELSNKKY